MAEKTYELIMYEKKDGVATITLNRPKVLNALNSKILREIQDALQDAEADESVRVIVITGAGDKAFSAGADIPELLEKSPVEARTYSIWLKDVLRYMERLQKPIIAKIRGFCLGGGLELAMACDF
ncbi:MAG TPA: enoyl-CoA hydratase/isomerase family protein, partial [Methanomicrobia archaeon]|nr:enoyl-CoA hydratase/isomerase family protein [Methanomicrobia archaeon]HEX59527.1 enoyl-CoA hydratase/isomerase family protein [Methanomicrobia archaeon]